MSVWVIPSREDPQPAEVLAEDKGGMEWVVEDSYKYQLQLGDQLQKQRL